MEDQECQFILPAACAASSPLLAQGRGSTLITGPGGPPSSESLLGQYRPPSSPLGRCQLGKTRRPAVRAARGGPPARAAPPPARWGGAPGRCGPEAPTHK